MTWRIYNADGVPVTREYSEEHLAWQVYLNSLSIHPHLAQRYRVIKEARGWRALERKNRAEETEGFLRARDVILNRCGLCKHSSELLRELLGIVNEENPNEHADQKGQDLQRERPVHEDPNHGPETKEKTTETTEEIEPPVDNLGRDEKEPRDD